MGSRKLNILIYTGTGATKESIRQCILTFTALLTPNYAIIPVSDSVILKEPWAATCAALVMPGGADLGYCRVLNGEGNRRISDYVRRGGSYVGFCAGGYYGSARCEFEKGRKGMEVSGSRELAFFDGPCRGAAFPGFQYQNESGARAARIKSVPKHFDEGSGIGDTWTSYCNGGGVFLAASKLDGVQVLAEYEEDIAVDGQGEKAAVVLCKVGNGSALLTGPHPEFAPENLPPQPEIPGYDHLLATLRADSASRTAFLRACLVKLGLDVPEPETTKSLVPRLTPIHLTSNDPEKLLDLICAWGNVIDKSEGTEMLRGDTDAFHLISNEDGFNVDQLKRCLPAEDSETTQGVADYSAMTKSIITYEDSTLPDETITPRFNHRLYYESLSSYRKTEPAATTWGNVLLYGDVVTSTNSMLEKNPSLSSRMPSGTAFAASFQVAGRGRGSNVWIAPHGSLLFSVVINHPAHIAVSRPVVFMSYIAAVAVVEAITSYGAGYEKLPVKLKWPNDIYAADPAQPNDPNAYVKIGGLLSQCNYCDGSYQITLGLGLNVSNPRPTTSIADLLRALPPSSTHPQALHMETLLARILTRLESVYAQFVRDGFSTDLERRYYRHWLHTGQSVALDMHAGQKARVLGITRDWGMLKVEQTDEEGRGTGRVWALQSDENSFDYWQGLVKKKI